MLEKETPTNLSSDMVFVFFLAGQIDVYFRSKEGRFLSTGYSSLECF